MMKDLIIATDSPLQSHLIYDRHESLSIKTQWVVYKVSACQFLINQERDHHELIAINKTLIHRHD